MPTLSRRHAIVLLAGMVLPVAAWRWWTADERAIRAQLTSIATAMSVDRSAGDIAHVARIATLRNALAPDVRILAAPPSAVFPAGPEIGGRDAVLALVGRWTPPAAGMTVEFVDLEVEVAPGAREAAVTGAARITVGQPAGQPAVDVVPLRATFARLDGRWLVTSAAPGAVLHQ